MKNIDLSILVEDTIIYIRVACLIKTSRGFLFEKSRHGYVFALGGKIKLGESSYEAVTREIMEEVGIKVEKLKLRSVLENFFTNNNEKVQEICFLYETDEEFVNAIPEEFVEISIDDIDKYDIRPKKLVDIIKDEKESFKHIIIKQKYT